MVKASASYIVTSHMPCLGLVDCMCHNRSFQSGFFVDHYALGNLLFLDIYESQPDSKPNIPCNPSVQNKAKEIIFKIFIYLIF